MVKRSRVLETEVDADVRYEETRLAKRATRARPRLAILLLAGVAGFAVEGALARDGFMIAGAIALVLVAWGVWKGKLGGVVAAALAAVLAVLIPLALMAALPSAWGEKVALAFVVTWGAIMLPDVLTLVRDAELQYAYGRWARREA